MIKVRERKKVTEEREWERERKNGELKRER